MSVEENKDLVRSYVATWDSRYADDDWAVLDDLWSNDCEVRLNSLEISGLDDLKGLFDAFLSAFPDMDGSVDDIIAEGDKVALRFSWTATHQGEFQGIPATGERVTVTGVGLYRIADGRIAEASVSDDALGLMQQIGAVPS